MQTAPKTTTISAAAILILAATAIFVLSSCDNRKQQSSNDDANILKEYVNNPKQRARAVGDAVEERNRRMLEQVDE